MGALGAMHQDLVKILEMARIEAFVRHCHGAVGRPPAERIRIEIVFSSALELRPTVEYLEKVAFGNDIQLLI